MKLHQRVYAQIDLDAIAYNMELLRRNLSENVKMAAVIKTDGYGHGALPIARRLESLDYVWGYAVATLDEAVQLKEHGIKKSVLVLGCVFEEQYPELLQYGIRANIYMEEMAKRLSKAASTAGEKAFVHIKLDTGMGRLGFPVCEESVDVIERISHLPNLEIEGLFTHFAKADEAEREDTLEQYQRFIWMQKKLSERGISVRYCHCDNSAGIMEYPQFGHDLVRAGIALYGLYPSAEVKASGMKLKQALELISHIIFVKEIEAGTAVSYGGTFVAPRRMKVATIPVGYGDGYARSLSNKGYVLIRAFSE